MNWSAVFKEPIDKTFCASARGLKNSIEAIVSIGISIDLNLVMSGAHASSFAERDNSFRPG